MRIIKVIMQHFVTESNWITRQLMDKISRKISDILPKKKLTTLIIDESGSTKKGDNSVEVGRKYCGNMGKVANCQEVELASLSNRNNSSLRDIRLYFPEDWCNDPERCDKADTPESERSFKTKAQLVCEIIEHQSEQVDFDFASADGIYVIDLQELLVRNTVKIILTGFYHFANIWIWNKAIDPIVTENTALFNLLKLLYSQLSLARIETQLLAIRKTHTLKDAEEIKLSFTNVSLDQHTLKNSLYAGRSFFRRAQHQGIKADPWTKSIPNSEEERMAASGDFKLLSVFFYPERKTPEQIRYPLSSTKGLKELVIFQLYRQMSDEHMHHKI